MSTPMRQGLSQVHVVRIASQADIVLASDYVRRLADMAGFEATRREALRTALTEVTHNVLRYARRGEARFRMVREGHRIGVETVVSDEGPGIASLAALREGHSSGGGLGAGLPAAKRLVDEFDIKSEPSKGTTVVLVKWARGSGVV